MKTILNLSIPKSCNEKWETFAANSEGAYCHACGKTVIDFSEMNDRQIVKYLQDRSSGTCGRLHSRQLKKHTHAASVVSPGLTLLRAGLLSLFLILVARPASAQAQPQAPVTESTASGKQADQNFAIKVDHIVKGIVRDESGEPLAGANIVLKNSAIGVITDSEGRFQFPKKLNEGDILVFSFLGYKTTEYIVPAKLDGGVDITLDFSLEPDMVMIMGHLQVDTEYVPAKTGVRGWWSKVKSKF